MTRRPRHLASRFAAVVAAVAFVIGSPQLLGACRMSPPAPASAVVAESENAGLADDHAAMGHESHDEPTADAGTGAPNGSGHHSSPSCDDAAHCSAVASLTLAIELAAESTMPEPRVASSSASLESIVRALEPPPPKLG